jgi:hypothetical protein
MILHLQEDAYSGGCARGLHGFCRPAGKTGQNVKFKVETTYNIRWQINIWGYTNYEKR